MLLYNTFNWTYTTNEQRWWGLSLFLCFFFVSFFLMAIFCRKVCIPEYTACHLWSISLLLWYFIVMLYLGRGRFRYVEERLPRACNMSRPQLQTTYNELERGEQKMELESMELEIRLKYKSICEKLVLAQQDYRLIFIKWMLGSDQL